MVHATLNRYFINHLRILQLAIRTYQNAIGLLSQTLLLNTPLTWVYLCKLFLAYVAVCHHVISIGLDSCYWVYREINERKCCTWDFILLNYVYNTIPKYPTSFPHPSPIDVCTLITALHTSLMYTKRIHQYTHYTPQNKYLHRSSNIASC